MSGQARGHQHWCHFSARSVIHSVFWSLALASYKNARARRHANAEETYLLIVRRRCLPPCPSRFSGDFSLTTAWNAMRCCSCLCSLVFSSTTNEPDALLAGVVPSRWLQGVWIPARGRDDTGGDLPSMRGREVLVWGSGSRIKCGMTVGVRLRSCESPETGRSGANIRQGLRPQTGDCRPYHRSCDTTCLPAPERVRYRPALAYAPLARWCPLQSERSTPYRMDRIAEHGRCQTCDLCQSGRA